METAALLPHQHVARSVWCVNLYLRMVSCSSFIGMEHHRRRLFSIVFMANRGIHPSTKPASHKLAFNLPWSSLTCWPFCPRLYHSTDLLALCGNQNVADSTNEHTRSIFRRTPTSRRILSRHKPHESHHTQYGRHRGFHRTGPATRSRPTVTHIGTQTTEPTPTSRTNS